MAALLFPNLHDAIGPTWHRFIVALHKIGRRNGRLVLAEGLCGFDNELETAGFYRFFDLRANVVRANAVRKVTGAERNDLPFSV